MGRSIIVLANCDHCGVAGEEHLFAMDVAIDIPALSKKPRLLDLCTDEVPDGKNCLAQFTEQVGPWIEASHAMGTEAPASRVRGSRSKTTGTGSNGPTPLDAQAQRLADGTGVVCDAPGCDSGPDGGPFVGRNALGVATHKSRRHGIPGQGRTPRPAAKKAAKKPAKKTAKKAVARTVTQR